MTAGFSLRFNCGLSARPTNYLSMITTHQNNQPTSAEHALTFLQLYDKRCNFHFCNKWRNQIHWRNGHCDFAQMIKLQAPKNIWQEQRSSHVESNLIFKSLNVFFSSRNHKRFFKFKTSLQETFLYKAKPSKWAKRGSFSRKAAPGNTVQK